MTALQRTLLATLEPSNVLSRQTRSLPSACFRVCQVYSRCAAGMLTSHRADPSWT